MLRIVRALALLLCLVAPASASGGVTWVHVEGPLDILDHAAPYYGAGSKVGIDATRKIPGEGIVREFPELLSMPQEIDALITRRWTEYGL